MKRTKWAVCPTCNQPGHFRPNGQQRWPDKVAAAHGLPTVIQLWTCPHCGTTLSEPELLEPADCALAGAPE